MRETGLKKGKDWYHPRRIAGRVRSHDHQYGLPSLRGRITPEGERIIELWNEEWNAHQYPEDSDERLKRLCEAQEGYHSLMIDILGSWDQYRKGMKGQEPRRSVVEHVDRRLDGLRGVEKGKYTPPTLNDRAQGRRWTSRPYWGRHSVGKRPQWGKSFEWEYSQYGLDADRSSDDCSIGFDMPFNDDLVRFYDTHPVIDLTLAQYLTTHLNRRWIISDKHFAAADDYLAIPIRDFVFSQENTWLVSELEKALSNPECKIVKPRPRISTHEPRSFFSALHSNLGLEQPEDKRKLFHHQPYSLKFGMLDPRKRCDYQKDMPQKRS